MTRTTRVAAFALAVSLIPTSTALASRTTSERAAVCEAGCRAAPYRMGDRPLSEGDRGADVKKLQRVLEQLGQRTTADGVFGAGTERAVKRYERTEGGGEADGVVEPEEATAMLEASRGERGEREAAGRRPAAPNRRGRTPSGAQPGGETDTTAGENAFPVQGTHKFGDGFGADRGGRSHQGADVFAKCGTPVVAPTGGEVTKVAQQAAAGNYVVVDTVGGDSHVFMHLKDVEAEQGATVKTGDAIGAVGETGNAQGCHLHFELWEGGYKDGTARDPLPDLKAWDSGQGETPPAGGEERAPADSGTTGSAPTESGGSGGASASR